MTKSELSEGISYLNDLSMNKYYINCAIEKMQEKIAELGQKKTINKPIQENDKTSFFDSLFVWVSIFGIGSAIIGWIIGLFIEHGFLGKVFNAIGDAIAGGLIGIGIGIVVGIFDYIISSSDEKKRIENKYKSDMDKYNKSVVAEKRRLSNELCRKKQLEQQLSILMQRKKSTNDMLIKGLNIMNINYEYSSRQALFYMNQFLSLGITDHLEGIDGLYYLVKQEIHANNLQNSVDNVSRKLDKLIGMERELYLRLNALDEKCDSMINSVVNMSAKISAQNNQIIQNTAIAVYNTERIEKEARYMLFLEALNN